MIKPIAILGGLAIIFLIGGTDIFLISEFVSSKEKLSATTVIWMMFTLLVILIGVCLVKYGINL